MEKPYKNNIKNFLPTRGSERYHKGMIDPNKCKKYFGDCKNEPIIYRSGLELDFINYCERVKSITNWASEPFGIKYISRRDKKEHMYYPDFVIENEDGKRTIVEIKPHELVVRPRAEDNKWLKEQWIKNVDKWTAAKLFADKNDMKFMIVTELFFNGK